MFFHQYRDCYSLAMRLSKDDPTQIPWIKRGMPVGDFYSQAHGWRAAPVEKIWWDNGRPYFNLWPSIAESLLAFDTSKVTFRSLLSAPDKVIAVQFPGDGYGGVKSVLVGAVMHGTDRTGDGEPPGHWKGALFCCENRGDGPCNILRCFEADSPLPILDQGPATLNSLLRLATAVMLLQDNPDVIGPDLLQRDEGLIGSSLTLEDAIQRAEKVRGQRGYRVGQAIESMPHYRRPHPALYWTGEGKRVAKIIFRRGGFVRQKELTSAPTGFHGSFGEAEYDEVAHV